MKSIARRTSRRSYVLSPDDLHALAELVSGQEGLTAGNRNGDDDPLSHIKLQLTVTLFRLGTKGVSVKKVAWIFGVSRGSVHAYTWRLLHIEGVLSSPQFVKKGRVCVAWSEKFILRGLSYVSAAVGLNTNGGSLPPIKWMLHRK